MPTIDELVNRAKSGDDDAFAALVTTHRDKVYSLALRMTGNPDDAEEMAQEAFLNVWRGLARFHGDSSFSTWVYRLTYNACIDFLRRERRRAAAVPLHLSVDGSESELQIADERPTPDVALERRDTREQVRRAIDMLSPEHREILLLREISGMSYAEISAVLSIEEGTVKSRIARARLSLRTILLKSGNFFPASSSDSMQGR